MGGEIRLTLAKRIDPHHQFAIDVDDRDRGEVMRIVVKFNTQTNILTAGTDLSSYVARAEGIDAKDLVAQGCTTGFIADRLGKLRIAQGDQLGQFLVGIKAIAQW